MRPCVTPTPRRLPLPPRAWGLWCAAWLAATAPAAAQPRPGRDCPDTRRAVEHFVPADCSACWRDGGPLATGENARGTAWQLDWVLPTAGHDAAMAEAALPEGTERLARRQGAAQPLHLRRIAGLKVAAGPAWMGYLGLELHLPRTPQRWPAGATAWTALVEQVPAGSAGNTGTRWLVRAVAGPWAVPDAGAVPGAPARAALVHRWAMRWPAAARVERLQARAWVEGPQGQLLAVAAEGCPR